MFSGSDSFCEFKNVARGSCRVHPGRVPRRAGKLPMGDPRYSSKCGIIQILDWELPADGDVGSPGINFRA